MSTTNTSKTSVGELLLREMEDKDISIRDMAFKTGIVYEHVRRTVRGEGIPSKYVLKLMCDVLGVDFKEAEKIATADKIRRRYGKLPDEIANKKPGLEPIERVWDRLTPQQQEDSISLIQGWAKRKK